MQQPLTPAEFLAHFRPVGGWTASPFCGTLKSQSSTTSSSGHDSMTQALNAPVPTGGPGPWWPSAGEGEHPPRTLLAVAMNRQRAIVASAEAAAALSHNEPTLEAHWDGLIRPEALEAFENVLRGAKEAEIARRESAIHLARERAAAIAGYIDLTATESSGSHPSADPSRPLTPLPPLLHSFDSSAPHIAPIPAPAPTETTGETHNLPPIVAPPPPESAINWVASQLGPSAVRLAPSLGAAMAWPERPPAPGIDVKATEQARRHRDDIAELQLVMGCAAVARVARATESASFGASRGSGLGLSTGHGVSLGLGLSQVSASSTVGVDTSAAQLQLRETPRGRGRGSGFKLGRPRGRGGKSLGSSLVPPSSSASSALSQPFPLPPANALPPSNGPVIKLKLRSLPTGVTPAGSTNNDGASPSAVLGTFPPQAPPQSIKLRLSHSANHGFSASASNAPREIVPLQQEFTATALPLEDEDATEQPLASESVFAEGLYYGSRDNSDYDGLGNHDTVDDGLFEGLETLEYAKQSAMSGALGDAATMGLKMQDSDGVEEENWQTMDDGLQPTSQLPHDIPEANWQTMGDEDQSSYHPSY